jgi:hypothetical protein
MPTINPTIYAFDDTLTPQTVPVPDIHVMRPHPTEPGMVQLVHGDPPHWVTADMDQVLCGLGWHPGYAKNQAVAARAGDPPRWPIVAPPAAAPWPRPGTAEHRIVMKHYMRRRRAKLRTEAAAFVLHGVLPSIDINAPEMHLALRRAYGAAGRAYRARLAIDPEARRQDQALAARINAHMALAPA